MFRWLRLAATPAARAFRRTSWRFRSRESPEPGHSWLALCAASCAVSNTGRGGRPRRVSMLPRVLSLEDPSGAGFHVDDLERLCRATIADGMRRGWVPADLSDVDFDELLAFGLGEAFVIRPRYLIARVASSEVGSTECSAGGSVTRSVGCTGAEASTARSATPERLAQVNWTSLSPEGPSDLLHAWAVARSRLLDGRDRAGPRARRTQRSLFVG